MDLFLLDAIPLDTDLVSEYPELVKLGDRLFEEVSGVAKTANKYRSKEALKLILINLFKRYRRGRAGRSWWANPSSPTSLLTCFEKS